MVCCTRVTREVLVFSLGWCLAPIFGDNTGRLLGCINAAHVCTCTCHRQEHPTWPRNDHHLQINPTCPDQSSTHQATMLGCNLGLVKLCMCHVMLHHHLQINFAYPHQGSTHKATRLGCNLVLLLMHWCTFRYVHRQGSCPISCETDYVSYATPPSAAQPHMPTSKPTTVAHQVTRLGCNLVLLV